MGKDSKVGKGKKTSKINVSKQDKGKIRRIERKSVRRKHGDGQLPSASSLLETSDASESCFTLLKDICTQAVSFQRHSLHNKLSVSDVLKASEFYNLKEQPSVSNEVTGDIDLENYLDTDVDVQETEKTFYCGKCLCCTEITGFEHSTTSQNLKDYFKFVMKAVFRNDSELFSISLSDLKKNPNIHPILPVFIHNLCNDTVVLNHQPSHLKKFIQIINALYLNPNLYFQSECIHKILEFIFSCALTNIFFIFDLQDDILSLQETAAQFVHDIFMKYHSHLLHYIISKLEIPFKAAKAKLISCCGSLTIINKLGLSVTTHILPLVFLSVNGRALLNQLSHELDSTEICAKKYVTVLKRELLDASQNLVKHSLFKALRLSEVSEICKVHESDKTFKNEIDSDLPLNINLCCAILDYYGDTLSSCLPSLVNESNKAVPVKDIFEMLLHKDKSEEKITP